MLPRILNINNLNKIKHIKTFEAPDNDDYRILSICELKNKRLVTSGNREIIVYNQSYQPQIYINAHNGVILSMCVLRNGDLASSSWDRMIKIWRIGENDYKLTHILKAHTSWVRKVVELEDGRICSCSSDQTIKIWDNNTYQCITSIKVYSDEVLSIIETNDSIISASDELRRWNKSSYESIQILQNSYCSSSNALEKLNDNTLLIGGLGLISVVNIESSEVKELEDHTLEFVNCFKVIRNDLVLFGNQKGEICSYNPISNQIISKSKFHNKAITCLIETEDNQLISCSNDLTINIYEYI